MEKYKVTYNETTGCVQFVLHAALKNDAQEPPIVALIVPRGEKLVRQLLSCFCAVGRVHCFVAGRLAVVRYRFATDTVAAPDPVPGHKQGKGGAPQITLR